MFACSYSRIGADAACCIRGLHDAGISWGTYAARFFNTFHTDFLH